MITLYFDKDFIEAFEKRNDHNDPIISDFYYQFIKRIRGVKVIINLNSIEELKSKIQENSYYSCLSEIGPTIVFDFKSKLNDETFVKEGSITKLFFVEGCDEKRLEKRFNFYFISNNTLKSKWKLFLSNKDDDVLTISSNAPTENKGYFTSWKRLNSFRHYIRNIFLHDLYILTNTDNHKIRDNLEPCIQVLSNFNIGKFEELTIVTKLLPKKDDKSPPKTFWEDEDIKRAETNLENIKKHFNSLFLIKYENGKNSGRANLHNRFIITNYFMIEAGAGFNIFKPNGKVNTDDIIRVESLLINKIRNAAIAKIINVKKYFDSIPFKGSIGVGSNKVTEHYYFYPENIKSKFFEIESDNE